MPDLLLELHSHEIPARMQRKAANDLKQKVTDALVENGLTYEAATPYWTPRRLTLDIRGLTARSKDKLDERKGPRVDAPQKAIDGFLRGAGLASIDDAEQRTDPKKGTFFVAVMKTPGRDAQAIVRDIMPDIIRNFSWPKSMRWGAASANPGALRWVRPLQSIVCVYGAENCESEIIDFAIDDLVASNITFGHRFHAPEPIKVVNFDDYAAKLQAAFVVLDGDRRKQMILSDAQNLAFASGLELVEDDALLEEVSGLVEWPVVLLGEFDAEFLQIPDIVTRQTIKDNQKCFVCRKAGTQELSNHFILTANIEASDGGKEIVHGNGKVVRARLSDALYFWNTDQQDLPDLDVLQTSAAKFELDMTKPLDQRMARLDHLNVTFHAKLGTQGERVLRIAQIGENLAQILGFDGQQVRRAALLAKADLQTEMVGEFPEVQGTMGRIYAQLQGEENAVCEAIEAHYKPQGPSDSVPANPVAICVALADKLDLLTGFWAIDEKPTGSKDPYGLRRAALGVIRILIDNNIRLNLLQLSVSNDLLAFFHDRLKVWLRDNGARYDLLDALIDDTSDDLLLIARRVDALSRFLGSQEGKDLLAGTRRAVNFLSQEEKKGAFKAGSVDAALFDSDEEKSLFAALGQCETSLKNALASEDDGAALNALAQLRAPIDAFSINVHVMCDDEKIRVNRLNLLARIRNVIGQVADFSKITER